MIMALNIDVNMYYDPKERMLDEIYLELLSNRYGWDEKKVLQVIDKLNGANLSKKATRDQKGNIIKRHKVRGNPSLFQTLFNIERKGKRYTTTDTLYDYTKNAIRFGVGNCDQCSAMAFIILGELASSKNAKVKAYLRSKSKSKRPWVERIVGNGHCMVMIGRGGAPTGSLASVNNLKTYQTDGMIVCDPWFFNEGGIIVFDKGAVKVIENGKLATTKGVINDGNNLWQLIVDGTKNYNKVSTDKWQSQALNQTHHMKLGAGLESAFRRNPKYKKVNFFDDPDGAKTTLVSVYREKHKQTFSQIKQSDRRKKLHAKHRKNIFTDNRYGKGEALGKEELQDLWKKIKSGETFEDTGKDTIIKKDDSKLVGDIVEETNFFFKIKTGEQTVTVQRTQCKKVIRTGGEILDKRKLLLMMGEAKQQGKERRIRLNGYRIVLKTGGTITGHIVKCDNQEIKLETADSDTVVTIKRKDCQQIVAVPPP
jgi:hypothetical protein